ncbi:MULTISPECIES: GNAT family N-acetyltransferase [Brevibacillus]|uniref:GNAT family N-acetyltransferase n=1 Tax=Brevibacillus TaxID=55080 RepID=UPI000EE7C99A|nr:MULTISPECIES: GNAT family N-acetyltransferase [Brevibacillus]MBU8716070.1 GNAT family N-acetyltransferase [Brevibacillus parabrevis]WDV95588.1 GNAT family N-acetyltransferase [Brevibacillus parabrevis]HBZ82497.1 N-acetyltransferase [Brevibacillus sp.]
MVLLRQATLHDLPAVCRIDALVLGSTSRAHELQTAIAAGHCHVASLDMDIAGFAVMNQSFFQQSFIHLVIVHPRHQHQGIGKELMLYLEKLCPTDKLFTSTNLSNKKMQRLCQKLGYAYSGTIQNLDPADPEVFYCKKI